MQAEAVEAEALRRSDELKTALLRSVSHDLRTPLTSIIAAGAALDSPAPTAEERARAERGGRRRGRAALAPGREPARRLAAGIGQGGAAPRAGRPRRGARGGPRAIGAETERGAAGARRASCRRRAPTPPSSSAPSPTCWRTRSATAAAGRCLVRSRLVGGSIVVRVVDQGPGIPESERQRIFEPFYRGAADGGAGRRPGSGWRSPRASSRPTAARSRSSRCPGRAAASSSASMPDARSGG